ncbi:MAG: ABC transporter permease [Solirubrobacterales bacterium]|nr:ABC transporter permease [Solirubrobacterales bacterium]
MSGAAATARPGLTGSGLVNAGGPEPGESPLPIQISAMASRSVKRLVRQPALVIPSVIFPLFLLAVNAGGLNAATHIPGFPTDSYLTFAIGFTFIQAAIFSTMGAGQSLAQDIENGFFSRLVLTPMRPTALMAGQLAGLVLLGQFQALLYLSVGLAAGADFAAGVAGYFVLAVLVSIISIGFGGIGLIMAIRTGSGEAVQGMFPLMFVLLFFSSMTLPRNLIEQDWYRFLATINPVSYLIEAIRSLFITGWDIEALSLGFGVAIVVAILSITFAARSLQGRMLK